MRVLRTFLLTALLAAGVAPPAQALAPADVAATSTLFVDLEGDGGGTVTSSPAGIDCGTDSDDCIADFEEGTVVTLTAAPDSLSAFIGWDGDCTGGAECVVTMSGDVDVWAEFDAPVLYVSRDGDGLGSVTSNPAGITCDDETFDCWEPYAPGTKVTLTATTGDNSIFVGWDGECSGTGKCVVTVDDDVDVVALFDTAWLEVEQIGDGSGVVTSDPAGIECGGASFPCSAPFLPGTHVTLNAAPGDDSVFTGWSGACSGTGLCAVVLDDDVEVGAAFNTTYVSVVRTGDGSGTVASSTGGLTCPSTCFETYLPGTTVTLTATPGSTSVFIGWSGPCDGTKSCTFVAGDDVEVEVAFDTGRVTVRTDGDGVGTVTSSPGGVACPSDCRESFLPGTQVTLAAVAGDKSVFLGWSGDCTGTGACVVDAGSDPTAVATFDSARLTVHRTGAGAGVVTSEPAGIDCGGDCFERFLPGSTVTLTASAQAGSSFAGWSGACAGLDDCILNLDTDSQVTATFLPPGVGGKITYECDYDICIMNDDGTGQLNLTNTPDDHEYAPTLSADGTKVAFMSDASLTNNPDGNIEIAWMNSDGTGLVQVTDSSGSFSDPNNNYDPDWSPDGTKIAFVATRPDKNPVFRQIYTVNADGSDETLISPNDYVTRLGPKWSPDGTKIAYTWWLGQEDVYVMNADGTGQTNITPDTLYWNDLSPSWSPDGTRLAFTTDRHYDPRTFNQEIYIVDADGTDFIRLTEDPAIDESPDWSPDGEWVAFSRYGDIYAVKAPPPGPHLDWQTEYEVKRLTSGPEQELEPYWAGGGQAALPMHTVKVRKAGKGTGTVTSSPGGIRCGNDCSEAFVQGSRVTLTATPARGSRVVGWSSPCPSSGPCTVTVTADSHLKVRFERIPITSVRDLEPISRLDRLE